MLRTIKYMENRQDIEKALGGNCKRQILSSEMEKLKGLRK